MTVTCITDQSMSNDWKREHTRSGI